MTISSSLCVITSWILLLMISSQSASCRNALLIVHCFTITIYTYITLFHCGRNNNHISPSAIPLLLHMLPICLFLSIAITHHINDVRTSAPSAQEQAGTRTAGISTRRWWSPSDDASDSSHGNPIGYSQASLRYEQTWRRNKQGLMCDDDYGANAITQWRWMMAMMI